VDDTCAAPVAPPTYYFGEWGLLGASGHPIPLMVARPGVFSARPIALPWTVGDEARPLLADYHDARTGIALYEDVDGSTLHVLRLSDSGDAWQEVTPTDAALRARMMRLLLSSTRRTLSSRSLGNVVLRANGPGQLAIGLVNRGSDPDFPTECSGIAEWCAYSWSWNGGVWTERVAGVTPPTEMYDEPIGLIAADERTVSGYSLTSRRPPSATEWIEIDVTSGELSHRPLYLPGGLGRITRDAILSSATVRDPDPTLRRICVHDLCTDHTILDVGRTLSYQDPTKLLAVEEHPTTGSVVAYLLYDTTTRTETRFPVPTPSSELTPCGVVPDPDGSSARIFAADTDIEHAMIEFIHRPAAADLILATEPLYGPMFGSVDLHPVYDCPVVDGAGYGPGAPPFFFFP
jgi:hypothetical protein